MFINESKNKELKGFLQKVEEYSVKNNVTHAKSFQNGTHLATVSIVEGLYYTLLHPEEVKNVKSDVKPTNLDA